MQPLGLLSRARIAPILLRVAAGLCLAWPGAAVQPPRTPVILISIDTLRRDHLSAYGYTRVHTPEIDSYAQPGTLFTAVDAQVPLTLPSHASLFTSTYPFHSRIEENAQPVPPGALTLASALRSQGYHTAAFIGSVFLERQMGLDQGFDLYDSPFSFEAFSPLSGSMFFTGASVNRYAVRDRRAAALVVHAAGQWLRNERGQPVFLFVHLFDLHTPYAIPPGERPKGLSGYDSELQYVDQQLGWLKRALIEGGWWDRSLVVLLSDHGEGLGEHGEATHGYFVYESTLAVPLLVHWPAGTPDHPAHARVNCGLIDVAPSILEFLHLPAPLSFQGRSLLKEIETAQPAPRAVYSETLYTHDAFGWAPLRALRLGADKYIAAPTPELYNLQADPHERNNLLRRTPAPGAERGARPGAEPGVEEARRLRDELTRLLAQASPESSKPPSGAAPGSRALLSSLGYLSGAVRPDAGRAGPDPKDRISEIRLYEDANLLLAERRFDQAGSMLRSLLARDPHNTLARRDLGLCHLALGHYAEARKCFQQVLATAPRDFLTRFQLGLAEEHLGRFQAALEDISAACEIAPQAQSCRTKLQDLKSRIR